MTKLLEAGFADSFRYLYPIKKVPILGGHILQGLEREMLGGE